MWLIMYEINLVVIYIGVSILLLGVLKKHNRCMHYPLYNSSHIPVQ